MTPILHLSVHQEMLTSTQLIFEFLSIFRFLLHNLVQVCHRITWLSLFRPMFFSPLLLERVVTRKLFFARRANRWLLESCWSMFFGHMIVRFLLIVCEIPTLGTRNNSSHAIFTMSSPIEPPVLFVTVLTCLFLIPAEWRHLKKKVRDLACSRFE